MRITLRCGCAGDILEDGTIIITHLCPHDALEVMELEDEEARQG